MARKVLIQLRRDTAANWTSTNPTLASGEAGYETDTGKLKIGDGVTAWTSLAYFGGSGGVTSLDSITGAVTLVAGSNVTITDNSPSAGEITIAAASGGPGALLYSNVLGVDSSSIDTGAGGFSTAYNILEVFFEGRTDEPAVLSLLAWNLNNDSGAHYGFVWTGTSNTSAILGNNRAQTAWTVQTLGASAAANYAGAINWTMPGYAGTTFYKSANWFTARADQSAAANMSMLNFGGSYQSTAAVSRIQIAPSTGGVKLKAGSALYVYGR